MSFATSSRLDPCPVCGDTSGKCRSKDTAFSLPNGLSLDDTQFFCMNLREHTATFKFTSETSNQLWGKFISFNLAQTLSNSWKNRYSSRSYRKPRPTIKRSPKPKKRSYSHLLGIGDRHKAISQLLAQLNLKSHHFRGLLDRGFSPQQIHKYGFKSVSYRQSLKAPISDRLAGVAPSGKSLTNKFRGLIVPIRDNEGHYLGWQYRHQHSCYS